MSFRDRFLTPGVARAITSPSAIVATGAGVSVGVLAGMGPWSILLGLAAWAARVLAAVPRARGGRDTAIAPRSLDQPWRGAVEQVQDSRRDFDEATRGVAEGPLRDRLGGVAKRLDTAVAEAWRIAKAGNLLSRGRKQIDTTRISSELHYARNRPEGATKAETIAAMEAQLASAARLDATIQDTYDRLVLLDARTDEVVARAVELAVSQADEQALGELDSDVGRIVGDLEALRLAIEETDDRPAAPGGPTTMGGAS
ncbi:MAG: hypothetical protein M9942_02305 [Microthrixaceae bacterium]|nr:hypothetical protein [Microthrixaceae bacterium]MCO5317245.1 hypothetical protein [Microthrixaceae bacterium]